MIINYLLSIKRHSESKTQVIRPTRTKRRKCHLRNTKRRMIMQSHSITSSSRLSSVKNRKMIINYLLSIKRHSESKTRVIRPMKTKRRKCLLKNTKRRMIVLCHSSSASSKTMTAKMKVKVPSKKAKMKLRTQKNQMKCRRCYPRPIMKLKILCLSISCHNKSYSPAT